MTNEALFSLAQTVAVPPTMLWPIFLFSALIALAVCALGVVLYFDKKSQAKIGGAVIVLAGLMVAGSTVRFYRQWQSFVADSNAGDVQWAKNVVAAVQDPTAIAEVELAPDGKSVAFLTVRIPVAAHNKTVVVLGKSVNVAVADASSFSARLFPKQIAILDAAHVRLADNIAKQLGAVAAR